MQYDATAFFSPIELFVHAGPVAKGVILLLIAASVWCWVLIIEGVLSVMRLNKAIRLTRNRTQNRSSQMLFGVIEAGRAAAALTLEGETAGEARARVAEAMSRAAQTLLARIEGGLPNLAVISAVAPFVGLFGTVWGIMVSFMGIAGAQDTSLAVVAPGIAQALAATAIGLAAAIPATVGYNRIGAALARASQGLQHVIAERAVEMTSVPPPRRGASPEAA
jgi:biopolymer transport protein ExbB/TolQ